MDILVNAPSTKTLSVKVFLEGLYAGSGHMNQAMNATGAQYLSGIADQITIELHDAASPYGVAYTYSNTDLHTDGTATITTIPGTVTGSYYLVIKHRNSIQTWSADPVSFSGSTISYDFSIAATQAFGSNMKLKSGVYTIYAGDETQDGYVDASDMLAIDNASTALLTGYILQDINGDGYVDATDMLIIDNNSTALVHVIKP